MAKTATLETSRLEPVSSASGDIEALSAQIATLRKDMASLAELVGVIGVRRSQEARETVEARASDMRDSAEQRLRDAGARVAELEHAAGERIRSHPLQAIGIAAAAGFLAGYLGGRR